MIEKFVCHLIKDGKKHKAERILSEAFKFLKTKGVKDPMSFTVDTIIKVSPSVQIRSVKRGGTSYQVPVPLTSKQALSQGIRWLVEAARRNNRVGIAKSLADELYLCSTGEGKSSQKLYQLYKLAEANRASAHYRWKLV